MATANQVYRFPNPPQKLTVGTSPGSTTSSEPFIVPQGMKVVTVFFPDFATSTAVVLEALTPLADVESSQTWVAVQITKLDTITAVAMSFADNKTYTLPCTALGGGILRWTVADTQASSPVNIYMIYSRDG